MSCCLIIAGGLSLFALATLVLDCLSLGYYYELQQCAPMLITTFPVVQAVFTIIQVRLDLTFGGEILGTLAQQVSTLKEQAFAGLFSATLLFSSISSVPASPAALRYCFSMQNGCHH